MIKRFIVGLLVTCALFFTSVNAQTISSQAVPSYQTAMVNFITGVLPNRTNCFFETHVIIATKLQQKYGFGIGAFYRPPGANLLLVGLRLEKFDGGVMMPQGTLQFAPTFVPFADMTTNSFPGNVLQPVSLTLFVYTGVGYVLSGTEIPIGAGGIIIPGKFKDPIGSTVVIVGYGFELKVASQSSWDLGIAADYETWTGLPGVEFRFALVLHVKK